MAAIEDASNSSTTRCKPQLYLLITNISKRANIRSLLLEAAAFDVSHVLVVGQPTFDFTISGADVPVQLHEAMEAQRFHIERFPSWKDCLDFLKENGIQLIGVEIHPEAVSLEDVTTFHQSTALLMGNEGQGLNEKQMKACDGFVRIPQFGGGTASLNVAVAASLVLHHYHQLQQRGMLG